MKLKTDFLIVGCGFYGAVLAERIANILKKKVTIVDDNSNNVYDNINSNSPYLTSSYTPISLNQNNYNS
jgi:UDP-galactopyranose mutase